MYSARFIVNGTGIEFERDYGCCKRTGWFVLYQGSVCAQFVSLPTALHHLAKCLWSRQSIQLPWKPVNGAAQ